ncbi:Uncharacterised protein [Mycobacteroides abscessus subsp. abscessus]|nr:Uncharacterised protein [Mycobacteroides abscessus subsp. abscessus]SIK75443.1 Uncharacterised protein [Mycobacteroides abscessus subsp. abscessus]
MVISVLPASGAAVSGAFASAGGSWPSAEPTNKRPVAGMSLSPLSVTLPISSGEVMEVSLSLISADSFAMTRTSSAFCPARCLTGSEFPTR